MLERIHIGDCTILPVTDWSARRAMSLYGYRTLQRLREPEAHGHIVLASASTDEQLGNIRAQAAGPLTLRCAFFAQATYSAQAGRRIIEYQAVTPTTTLHDRAQLGATMQRYRTLAELAAGSALGIGFTGEELNEALTEVDKQRNGVHLLGGIATLAQAETGVDSFDALYIPEVWATAPHDQRHGELLAGYFLVESLNKARW